MKTNKILKVLTSTALLASIAAPFAATSVFADSKNVTTTQPKIADDFENKTLGTTTNDYGSAVSVLVLKQDNTSFAPDTNKIFRLTLPSGVKFVKDAYAGTNPSLTSGSTALTGATVQSISDQTLELKMTGETPINVPLYVKVDGATGDLKVTVDSMDTTITPGTYTFAQVSTGKTSTVVEELKTVGKNGNAGTIRIDENSIGAVGNDSQTVTVKLPTNVSWDATPTVRFTGGFSLTAASSDAVGNGQYYVQKTDDRTLKITFNPNDNRTQRGAIYIDTPSVKNEGTNYGEVTASVTGSKVSDADVVLFKYADWGAGVTVTSVKDIIAGKVDGDIKTDKITIEEGVIGSLYAGRDLDIELPSWVKIVGYSDFKSTGLGTTTGVTGTLDGSKNKLSVKIGSSSTGTTKGKIELKLHLSVDPTKSGDITASFSGAGLVKQDAVIAKAVAPVTVTSSKAADINIGVQNQIAPDFTIVENKKEAIEKTTEEFSYNNAGALNWDTDTATSKTVTTNAAGGTGEIQIDLPNGVSFAAVPTVQVVDGNGEIEVDSVKRTTGTGANSRLIIPVKSESTKPMSIKVSNVKLTVDRTVPEGPVEAKVGGTGILENYGTAKGQFNAEAAAKFTIANTVTPAPGNTTTKTLVFKLGATSYKVDGVETTMDVAPFAQNSRTYLPVRFAAEALGAKSVNWDQATKTATIMKDGNIVQMKLGEKAYYLNGVRVPMDVAVVATKEKRIVLPIRFLGDALGVYTNYDETTNEITVSPKATVK